MPAAVDRPQIVVTVAPNNELLASLPPEIAEVLQSRIEAVIVALGDRLKVFSDIVKLGLKTPIITHARCHLDDVRAAIDSGVSGVGFSPAGRQAPCPGSHAPGGKGAGASTPVLYPDSSVHIMATLVFIKSDAR